MTKKCRKCNVVKPTSEFNKNKRHKDGLHSYCKECLKTYLKEYKEKFTEKDKEKIREKDRKRKRRLRQDPEFREKENARRRTEEYREKARKNALEWYYKNHERVKLQRLIHVHKSSARKRNLLHTFTEKDWKDCLEYFDHSCAYCGKKGVDLEQEHVIPVSKGGHYIRQNIVPACESCNSSKNNNDIEYWYRFQLFFNEKRLQKIYKWMNVKPESKYVQMKLF